MPWMPSPELENKLINDYLIDELRERFHSLSSSEKEELQRRLKRAKQLEKELAKSKEKLSVE